MPRPPNGDRKKIPLTPMDIQGLTSDDSSRRLQRRSTLPGFGSRARTCSCRCSDSRVDLETVFAEERACIREARDMREQSAGSVSNFEILQNSLSHPIGGEPFSVCFSGGGVRAAAFQAGVLWRLAKENRLKDVEYLAAVSGGGYVASAFASHCIAEQQEEPPRDGDLQAWYLKVVAKMICRMQSNAGNFVRDCVKTPGYEDEGAGILPRWCDTPILICVLLFTMAVNPIMFIAAILVPTAAGFQLFFGAGLRAAFCIDPQTHKWLPILLKQFTTLYEWSSLDTLVFLFLCAIIVAFVVQVFPYACVCIFPCARIRDTRDGAKTPTLYLIVHALRAFVIRFTAGLFLALVGVFLILLLEIMWFSVFEDRKELCARYIHRQEYATSSCTDRHGEYLWYNSSSFSMYNYSYGDTQGEPPVVRMAKHTPPISFWGVMSAAFFIFTTCVIGACCAIPFWGTRCLWFITKGVGPFVVLLSSVYFVEFGIFGPLTYSREGYVVYNQSEWEVFVKIALFVGMLLLPCYEELRSGFHTYYKRCLQKNFFAKGEDVNISDITKCPHCPFLILTVTACDYQAPGATDNISEMSLSPLHCGGSKIGYIKVEEQLSLAKCAALSGAGCLDAITLSMSNNLSLRFWLEVVNLSWGDFILFDTSTTPLMNAFVERFPSRLQLGSRRILSRSSSAVYWLVMFFILNLGWHYDSQGGTSNCLRASALLYIALWMFICLLFIAFFSFIPCFDLLGMSLLTRQLLQATRYCYVGDTPPRMLYVSDGGVADCTALLQLMQRQCQRILLVLAAADSESDLAVLRTTMTLAEKQKIGSFFDPADARRSVDVLLEDFKYNKEKRYLHIGICYSWDGEQVLGSGSGLTCGELYIVKNRLPTSSQNQPVQQLLTEHDIFDETPLRDEGWEGLTTDHLGSCGCCDCCHTCGGGFGNCGPKFPHGGFCGYLYLTPQWCNSLIRLGFDLSKSALDDMFAVA